MKTRRMIMNRLTLTLNGVALLIHQVWRIDREISFLTEHLTFNIKQTFLLNV